MLDAWIAGPGMRDLRMLGEGLQRRARRKAGLHAVALRVVPRCAESLGIDVDRLHPRGPEKGCRNPEDARAASVVEDLLTTMQVCLEPFQAQAGRGMAAGAEGKPGIEDKGRPIGRMVWVPTWTDPEPLADSDRLKLRLRELYPILLDKSPELPFRLTGQGRHRAGAAQQACSLRMRLARLRFEERAQSVALPPGGTRRRTERLGMGLGMGLGTGLGTGLGKGLGKGLGMGLGKGLGVDRLLLWSVRVSILGLY